MSHEKSAKVHNSAPQKKVFLSLYKPCPQNPPKSQNAQNSLNPAGTPRGSYHTLSYFESFPIPRRMNRSTFPQNSLGSFIISKITSGFIHDYLMKLSWILYKPKKSIPKVTEIKENENEINQKIMSYAPGYAPNCAPSLCLLTKFQNQK